jgi:hypothetical protein
MNRTSELLDESPSAVLATMRNLFDQAHERLRTSSDIAAAPGTIRDISLLIVIAEHLAPGVQAALRSTGPGTRVKASESDFPAGFLQVRSGRRSEGPGASFTHPALRPKERLAPQH